MSPDPVTPPAVSPVEPLSALGRIEGGVTIHNTDLGPSSATAAVLAAPRDASAWPCPNTRSPKRVHVAVNVEPLGNVCGFSGGLMGDAACDPGRMPLDMTLADPAEQWPVHVRCRRAGCAARWAEGASR